MADEKPDAEQSAADAGWLEMLGEDDGPAPSAPAAPMVVPPIGGPLPAPPGHVAPDLPVPPVPPISRPAETDREPEPPTDTKVEPESESEAEAEAESDTTLTSRAGGAAGARRDKPIAPLGALLTGGPVAQDPTDESEDSGPPHTEGPAFTNPALPTLAAGAEDDIPRPDPTGGARPQTLPVLRDLIDSLVTESEASSLPSDADDDTPGVLDLLGAGSLTNGLIASASGSSLIAPSEGSGAEAAEFSVERDSAPRTSASSSAAIATGAATPPTPIAPDPGWGRAVAGFGAGALTALLAFMTCGPDDPAPCPAATECPTIAADASDPAAVNASSTGVANVPDLPSPDLDAADVADTGVADGTEDSTSTDEGSEVLTDEETGEFETASADGAGSLPTEDDTDEPEPVEPPPPPDTTDKPPPPPPSEDDPPKRHSATEWLEMAEAALASNDPANAFKHARASYKNKKSARAAEVMAEASCLKGDKRGAEIAIKRLRWSKRSRIKGLCAMNGVKLK